MIRVVVILILCFAPFLGFAQGKGKVIYKYKKFQEFDMEDLNVAGELGSPGDITSEYRFQREFKNKLPLRKNFNPELRRSVEVIR